MRRSIQTPSGVYATRLPVEFIGEICGELVVRRNGLVVAMEDSEDTYEIPVRVAPEAMAGFEAWLAALTSRGHLKRLYA